MKLLVIDGNSIVNRAFFGMHELTNDEGFPTHAIYGFLNILRRLQDEVDPDGLCVAFDRKEPTFRHLAYPAYKAQRKGMPEELAVQMPVLKEVLAAMNVPCYELAGWEADDLIGTIARRCEQAGWDCRVATGDKDSLQLVTEGTYVELVTSRMGKTTTKEVDPAAFRETYGMEPPRMVDLKALMGDASDNVPGVPGVGEKTAMALLHGNESLHAVYDRLDDGTLDAKPGVKKKLTEGRESAFLSYDLCTIRRDAPLDFEPQENISRPANRVLLRELFQKLGFKKLLSQMGLEEDAPAPTEAPAPVPAAGEQVTGRDRWQALLDQWQGQTVAVLALADLSVLAVCRGEEVFLFRREGTEDYDAFLRGLLSPAIPKIGYNTKDVMSRALSLGISAEGFCFDVALAAYLLAPTDGSYEPDKVAARCFSGTFPPAKDYLGAKVWQKEESAGKALDTMARHAALLQALYDLLPGQLTELGLDRVYEEVERPLCPVLAEMEQTGVLVDREALEAFGQTLKAGIARSQQAVFDLAGEAFNLNSTQQLGQVLFEHLGLPPVKKTKTGYSTSAEVLESLRGKHEIIDEILEYRKLAKLKSTYVDGLLKVVAEDGRIHTHFNQTDTRTGRLSSTEPNLQNIPVRTELGSRLRAFFKAQPDCELVDADYSQIELRVLAHISQDENMISAFNSDEDIHTNTAAQVFDMPPLFVTPEMRRKAKAVNFGIVYGIGAFSLSQDIGVSVAEADRYIKNYLDTFSGVRRYMEETVEFAQQHGYIETMFGRRRALPEIHSTNKNIVNFGKRVAMNTPIQGTAADIIKIAMIKVYRRLKAEQLSARLILQVHDELIVEAPLHELEQVKHLLVEEMQNAVQLSVLLKADVGCGKSWLDAK